MKLGHDRQCPKREKQDETTSAKKRLIFTACHPRL